MTGVVLSLRDAFLCLCCTQQYISDRKKLQCKEITHTCGFMSQGLGEDGVVTGKI